MVEDPKLLDAFQFADERLVVPSRSNLKGAVKKQYDEKKAETIKELDSVEWVLHLVEILSELSISTGFRKTST